MKKTTNKIDAISERNDDYKIIYESVYEKYERMFPDKFYLKMFKMIDRDPEYFMSEVLRNLGFEQEEEYDILYNYFVNYSDSRCSSFSKKS